MIKYAIWYNNKSNMITYVVVIMPEIVLVYFLPSIRNKNTLARKQNTIYYYPQV